MRENRDVEVKNKKQKICQNCGAIMVESSVCVVCGAPKGQKEVAIIEQQASSQTNKPITVGELYKQRRFTRLVSGVLVVVFLLASVSVASREYLSFQKIKGLYNAKQSVIYNQNNQLLKIRLNAFEEPIVLDRYYNNYTDNIKIEKSYDHRFVAYLGNQKKFGNANKGILTLIDLVQLNGKSTTSSVARHIISDAEVIDFVFIPKSDKLVYLTVGGDLYSCDYSKVAGMIPTTQGYSLEKLDSRVTGLVNESENSLLYHKGQNTGPSTLEYNKKYNNGNSFDLYLVSLTKKDFSIQLVDKNVYSVADVAEENNNAIYTRLTKKDPLAEFSLIYYDISLGKSKVLADKIAIVQEANASNGSAFYLVGKNNPMLWEGIFIDDLLENDKLMENPEELESSINNELMVEEDETQARIDEYEFKILRDELRDKLNRLFSSLTEKKHIFYELFYIKSHSSDPIIVAEDILALNGKDGIVNSKLDKGLALFVAPSESQISKIIVSELTKEKTNEMLDSAYQIEEFISENISEALTMYYVNLNETKTVYTEKGERTIYNYVIDDLSSEIYFISKSEYRFNSGVLYSSKFSNTGVEKTVYIDDYVYAFIGTLGEENQGVLYQTASRDEEPEYILYSYSDDSVFQIADKTSSADYVEILGNKNDSIYFFRNYSKNIGYGNLYKYRQNEEFLAEKIDKYQRLGDDKMLLIQDEDGIKKLILLNENKLTVVDKNIGAYVSFDNDFYP